MTAFNIIFFSLSYSIILLGMSNEKSIIAFLKAFAPCAIFYVLFVLLGLESFYSLPITFISAFCTRQKGARFLLTLFKTLSAMLVLTIYVLIMGTAFLVINPGFMNDYTFDIFMGISSFIYAVCIYKVLMKKDFIKYLYDSENTLLICVLIEFSIIAFVSFIIPLALATNQWNYILCSYYFVFLVSIFFISYLSYNLTKAKARINHDERMRLYSEIHAKVIDEKFNSYVSLKHYYTKLYHTMSGFILKHDMNGLTEYFNKYVLPLQKVLSDNSPDIKKLDLIKMPLIHNLLIDTLMKAKHFYNANVSIEITSVIEKAQIEDIDLFYILSEWIDNAFSAVQDNKGDIDIFVSYDNGLIVQVSNPFYEEINMNVIDKRGYTTKEGHNGVGLADVTKIISSYKNIEHMTYIEFDRFFQYLSVRNI